MERESGERQRGNSVGNGDEASVGQHCRRRVRAARGGGEARRGRKGGRSS